jgi:hypothetical protein
MTVYTEGMFPPSRPLLNYFRIADNPGVGPSMTTSAFIGTNPELFVPDCPPLGNNRHFRNDQVSGLRGLRTTGGTGGLKFAC